ncbi:PKD domain-containing protein [Parasediminibacterium sp. JCM 36343]|uniref:PKD domain-containing protein n=1 Tax=Parasediminibacterium sp. JCM 36343 TaxID=3374279 RepID=UPI00397DDE49
MLLPTAEYKLNTKTIKKTVSVFILCLLGISNISAQVIASFTADKTSGCVKNPSMSVRFTSTTQFTKRNNPTFNWSFVNTATNAITTSHVENPVISFPNAGSYTASLTVTDNGASSSYTYPTPITVHVNPIADFSASPLKGCIPFNPTFTSTSTPGEGTIDTYIWDFGDGNTTNSQGLGTTTDPNPYTSNQKYTVSLTVTNTFGCKSDYTVKQDYIEAVTSVQAQFTANQTVLCTPGSVSFTNTSTGNLGATPTASWDFGDGTTSNDISPVHLYTKKGIFTVTLTQTSSYGCSSTSTQSNYINIGNFSSSIISAAQACTNTSISFQGTANPTPTNSNWYFSDNNNYYQSLNAYVTFYVPGTVTAMLVNTYGNCKDTATKQITVLQSPSPSGFSVLSSLCGAPANVTFKDTTFDAVSWHWSLGYYNPIALPSGQTTNYTFNSEGTYEIYMTVTNAANCSTTILEYITIQNPHEYISYTKSSSQDGLAGCEGMQITFQATPTKTVTKFLWDFGDGTTSTDSFPIHQYAKEGRYTVKLAYTTASGCTGNSNTVDVNVYKKPVADFNVVNTTICGNTPVVFNITSTPNQAYSHFLFGDGLEKYAYNDPSVMHQYFNKGIYDVTLIAGNGSSGTGYCYDTIVKLQYITVVPPFPKIANITNTCDGTRGEVTFTQSTRLATGWQWDFGDGKQITLTTNQIQVKHTYEKTGSYKVIHSATNGSCTVSDSSIAYVLLKQKPALTLAASEVCASGNVGVTINNLEQNPYKDYYYNNYSIANNGIQYGDGSIFTGSTSPYYYDGWLTYTGTFSGFTNGKENLTVITRSDYFGCLDTTNPAPLKIKGPSAGYKLSGSDCYKKAVIFTDTSSTKNNVLLTKWQWDFGDNTTPLTITGANGDTSYIYSKPGSYYTSLTITDAEGCTANTGNYSHIAQAYGPKADFYWSPTNISPNSTAYFYNNSNDFGSYNNIYTWSFTSDNSTKTTYSQTSISHAYTNALTDTVKLIAKSNSPSYTCVDEITRLVPVRNIEVSFTNVITYIDPNNTCPPARVQFTANTYNVSRVRWIFGNGNTAPDKLTPSATYNAAGTYKVTLIGYGFNNDSAIAVGNITIKGPYARLTADVYQGCKPLTVTFTAHDTTTPHFEWDFGDGNVVDGKDTFTTYTYNSPGEWPTGIGTYYYDSATKQRSCYNEFHLDPKILVDTLGVTFTNNPFVFCVGTDTKINISTVSTALNYIDSALQYHWNFGTGNPADTSNLASPSFKYTVPGKDTLSLYVKSITGCEVKLKDTVTVKPVATASISGVSSICEGVLSQYTATTTSTSPIKWKWEFNNGNNDTTQIPALQALIAKASSLDSIYVTTNLDGCMDTAYHLVTVYKKPVIDILPRDPAICLDKAGVVLTAHDGINFDWSPKTFISDTLSATPTVNPKNDTKYKVQVINANKCVNTDSVSITVAKPFILYMPKDTSVCINSSVQLYGSAPGIDSFQWINGTNGLSNTNISNPLANPIVKTTYTLVGYDKYKCFTDTNYTTVFVEPLPTVNAGNSVTIPVGTDTKFTPLVSNDVTKYQWVPSNYLDCDTCPTPTATPRADIGYTLTVKTQYGCEAKGNISIKLLCQGLTLSMPTGFVPNSKNSLTNRFYPIGKGVKIVKKFTIYNRLGASLFEKSNFDINDASFGWDGRYHDADQPAGTYVYVLEATCDTGYPIFDKGTVVLIR